jgi:uncharacterized membrane protein
MKLKYTKVQIALEILCLLLIAGMIVFIGIRYQKLPDKIPGHYNAAGEINRWGNKSEIFVTPIISILLYIFITVVTFFPQIWNVPGQLSESNRIAVYQCIKSMVICMKLEMVGVFFYITYYMAYMKTLPAAFLPVMLVILFGTILFFIIRMVSLMKH